MIITKEQPKIITEPHQKEIVSNQLMTNLVDAHGHKGAMDVVARLSGYKETPPLITDFIDNDEYLGKLLKDEDSGDSILYPIWRSAAKEIFPNPYYSPYLIVVFTGAIGLGKSSISILGLLYDLCKLLCLEDPHSKFKLIKSTQIVYMFMNATLSLSKGVLYDQAVEWIMTSPWFKQQNSKALKTQMFPNNIGIMAGSRAGQSLGRAVAGSIFSEAAFGVIKEQFKKNFDSILARMQSRFLSSNMQIPGHLWIDSSKADVDSFVERLIESRKTDPTLKVYDYPVWEVKGHLGIYEKTNFKVFAGDSTRDPFVIERPEQIIGLDDSLILDVPTNFRQNFESDIITSLRDIAGRCSFNSSTFFSSMSKIESALKAVNPVTKEIITLDFFDRNQKLIDFILMDKLTNKKPKFIHIDLGLKHDKTAIAASRLDGYIDVSKNNPLSGDKIVSTEPIFTTEFLMVIDCIPGQEVPIYKIKDFILDLKVRGYHIALVSTDGYQSSNLRQDLLLTGIDTELISVDRTKDPYNKFKNALLEERYYGVDHPRLKSELKGLIENFKKIDHPIDGCFTGDTIVNLFHKETLSLKRVRFDELTKGSYSEDYYILSYNQINKKFSYQPFTNPRITKRVNEVIELEFDNGSKFKCTFKHRILTTEGYVDAIDLFDLDDVISRTGITNLVDKNIITCDEEPVYDLTSETYENFSIEQGLIVHNSKDAADAIVGSIWASFLRKEKYNANYSSEDYIKMFSGMTQPNNIYESITR